MFYYKIQNLDSRIQNPDQRLTKDAEMWANSLSTLFVNIAKPILDITMFSVVHRPSAMFQHTQVLRLDGSGRWTLEAVENPVSAVKPAPAQLSI